MAKFYIFLIILLSTFAVKSQVNFGKPMDIPLRYAGNFGEIRPNHFHTGVDIKTNGTTGKKIFSVGDGYISRIKIQLWGYGKVIYVTHYNGYTSVYAHMSRFNNVIDSIVKENQYEQKSYTLDLYLLKNKIKVKKHELLGFSGNTGNSFAPHLHFEIRDNKTEYAQNPYLFNFKPVDNIPPKVFDFLAYPIDSSSLIDSLNRKKFIKLNKYFNADNIYLFDTLNVSGNIGFGVSVLDYINNSRNKFAPYSIELFVDSVRYAYIKFNEFDFYDKNYINSYIDYKEYLEHKKKIHKLFIDENSKIKIFKYSKNNGVLNFYDNNYHYLKIIIKDYNSNKAVIKGVIKSNVFYHVKQKIDTSKIYMKFFENNLYSTHDFIVNIPKSALTHSIYFDYSIDKSANIFYSGVFTIGNKYIPLFKKISIGLNTENVPKKYLDKIIIVKINKNNRYLSYKGSLKNNFIYCRTNTFGKYAIMADTVAPVIKPLNIRDGAKFINDKFIKFKIYDNLSGITKINGYIDNKWICFEYDPKKSLISYEFDKRIQKNKYHDFRLEVSDYKNNTSVFNAQIFY